MDCRPLPLELSQQIHAAVHAEAVRAWEKLAQWTSLVADAKRALASASE